MTTTPLDVLAELQTEAANLREIVRSLQNDTPTPDQGARFIRALLDAPASPPLNQFTDAQEVAARTAALSTPMPVELPAHWRALAQILRNLADRIVHMTSLNRGHLLKQLNDVDWHVYYDEWDLCCVCAGHNVDHDFGCPVKTLETLMKVHGGVL